MKQSFNKEYLKTLSILSFGTFLEYFDLYLHVHLAFLLNEIFFYTDSPRAAFIIASLAFCSNFVFRPIGALIFGYLGDKIGRRFVIFLTSTIMGVTCIVMFYLPSYAEIGIYASIIVTLCRILQGMAGVGELIGAELYLVETSSPPKVYVFSTLLTLSWTLGGAAAIFASLYVIKSGIDWRNIFLFGAIIAFSGIIFRTMMLEVPAFEKKEILSQQELHKQDKVDIKNILAYFSMQCLGPISFYIAFIYCPIILSNQGYNPLDILSQNLVVSLFDVLMCLVMIFLVLKYHPLDILKVLSFIYLPCLLLLLYLLSLDQSPIFILVFQIFIICFTPTICPANPLIYKSFPIYQRFRIAALTFTIANSLMYIIISFGALFLTDLYGFWGLLILIMPLTFSYIWGLNHFIEYSSKT